MSFHACALALGVRSRNAGCSVGSTGPVQVPTSRSEPHSHPYTGLGMGLFIVREIVNRHDGTVTVASAAETVFTVRLPRVGQPLSSQDASLAGMVESPKNESISSKRSRPISGLLR